MPVLRGRSPIIHTLKKCPLDGIPGVFAAFSSRRLLSSYKGPHSDRRRSSDSATMTTGFDTSGWANTNEAKLWGGADTQYVTGLYDQVSGVAAVQATTTLQPSDILAGAEHLLGVRSRSFIKYDAPTPDVGLTLSSVVFTGGAVTILAMVRSTARNSNDSNNRIVGIGLGSSASTTGLGLAFSATISQDWDIDDVTMTGNGLASGRAPRYIANDPSFIADGKFHLWEGYLSADRAELWLDGRPTTPQVQSVGAVPDITSDLRLGYGVDANDRGFSGYMSEAIIFNADMWGKIDRLRRSALLEFMVL